MLNIKYTNSIDFWLGVSYGTLTALSFYITQYTIFLPLWMFLLIINIVSSAYKSYFVIMMYGIDSP
jgi:hypothetical protein